MSDRLRNRGEGAAKGGKVRKQAAPKRPKRPDSPPVALSAPAEKYDALDYPVHDAMTQAIKGSPGYKKTHGALKTAIRNAAGKVLKGFKPGKSAF